MKKFYKQADVASADGGFTVRLDGKSLRTPRGILLAVASERLAQAVAQEWNGQGEAIEPSSMPMTRMAFAVVETTAERRQAIIAQLLGNGRTDLVSYRAEWPEALYARQVARWEPLLTWLRETHGATLAVTRGITHTEQPEAAIAALKTVLSSLNGYELVALHAAATITGSLTIGLALIAGRLSAAQAFDAAHVDEHFQAGQWGHDAEAGARREKLKAELETVERFLSSISPLPPEG